MKKEVLSFKSDSEIEKKISARSSIYRLLSDAFDFPHKEFFSLINSGEFYNVLKEQSLLLPYTIDINPSIKHPGFQNFEEFEAEFIKIFDISVGGPPCPLYEGLYFEDRQGIMSELMRFYEHFGLELNKEQRELPDHISIELEFMHYLIFKEAGATHFNKDPKPYLFAQRDFMERHIVRLLPKISERLKKIKPPEFFANLFNFLFRFSEAEYKFILTTIKE